MKKILALLLVVVMAVSMCACGSGNGTNEKPTTADNKTADAAKPQGEQTGTVKDTAVLQRPMSPTGSSLSPSRAAPARITWFFPTCMTACCVWKPTAP